MKQDINIGVGSEDLLDTIESSIERRWKSCDQDVYIAAILLNPLLKMAPFARIPLTAPVNLWAIIKHLWKRFYNKDPPFTLFTELTSYLLGKDRYSGLLEWANNIKLAADSQVLFYLFNFEATTEILYS